MCRGSKHLWQLSSTELLYSATLYLTSSQLLLSQLVSSGVVWVLSPIRLLLGGLTDLLAFLFISLSPGCKCDTRGTISGIAECQQVGLLLSASRHLQESAVLGAFQLRLSQQLLERPVLTPSSQRLHHNLGLHENIGLRPVIN